MPISLDELQTAVWVYDSEDYSIIWANQAALTLWDSSSVEALKKETYKQAYQPPSKTALFNTSRNLKRIRKFKKIGTLPQEVKTPRHFVSFLVIS